MPIRAMALLWALLLSPAVLLGQTQPEQTRPEGSAPVVHAVLFTAAGLEPPAGATEKIAASAEYAEAFFAKWMTHWGYPPARERIFGRDENGKIRVLHVRGSKPAAEYDEPQEVLSEVWADAHPRYGLPMDQPIWWVWAYKGDPPVRFQDYRGSGEIGWGGWAVVNYENRPGLFDPKGEMGSGFLKEFTLKACIHELGHGLGLFHIGPVGKDRLGNTLMGPTELETAARNARDRGVYLSAAEAALLWKHWVFTGDAAERWTLPSVEVRDYHPRYSRSRNEITVTGTLVSNGTAHSVVLVDEAPPRQEDYRLKAYAARMGEGGRFEVRVREPSGAAGTFRLLFCFENGAVTGDGKSRDPKAAPAKRYTVAGKTYRFEP